MEEGRDRPSEDSSNQPLWQAVRPPQWRRAEIGPRRVEDIPVRRRPTDAAMEEGRDRPSEAIETQPYPVT